MARPRKSTDRIARTTRRLLISRCLTRSVLTFLSPVREQLSPAAPSIDRARNTRFAGLLSPVRLSRAVRAILYELFRVPQCHAAEWSLLPSHFERVK
jgi:hypothetical protein